MISATIIKLTKYPNDKIVTTFELEYPRYIHSELMTHRVFSRNAASSRAIPIEKMLEQATDNTVMPMWTKNQAGMQGTPVKDIRTINNANTVVHGMLQAIVCGVSTLDKLGIHKQNANRYLEPFQHIKTIVTTTETDNFFKLRYHPDAQPEIRELAKAMLVEYMLTKEDAPVSSEDTWHLPYTPMRTNETLANLKIISASCCAQVSYRKNDDSLVKAKEIYDRLVTGKPMHASPFEHQCRPLLDSETQKGNLQGFRQLRQDIEESL